MNSNNIGNESNLHVRVEETPPPPYSETDIYSNSDGPRSPNTNSPNTNSPASSRTIDAATDDGASRLSSSTSELVLTPPETPRRASAPQPQPSAALYFESRPAPAVADAPRETLVNTVNVRSATLPDDLPYRTEWAARDVTTQDWATFVNFLLPDHTTRGNEAVIDRKMKAEGGGDAASTSGGRSHAEAQLEHTREAGPEATRRKEDAEATVRQWNDGFFGPRGISVRLDPAVDPARMPGSWDTAFDADAQGLPSSQRQRQQQHTRSCGGFSIDDNGIRFGDRFVADINGLRIGSLVMDNNGIHMGGQGTEPASTGPGRGSAFGYPPAMGSFGSPFRYGVPHVSPDRHHHDHHHHWGSNEFGGRHGHHGGDERGRRCHSDHRGTRERSGSASSNSSSSSSSSSSSESSIGSLPDYDHVRDAQRPLYAASLRDWISHPDQMRSKSDVKQLKMELKSATTAPVDPNLDQKALKTQLKGLTQAWKQIKRDQKTIRKATRRERRQRRKAERRERKQNRRDMRRARRDHKRVRGWMPWMPPIPQAVPAMPPMPAAPAAPPAPPAWCGPSRHNRGACGPSQPGGGRLFGSSQSVFGRGGPFGPRGLFGNGRPCGDIDRRGRPGGFGGGGGGGSWGQPTRTAPGAWPEDKQDVDDGPHEAGVATPPPGAESAAKYRAADGVEAEIHRKMTQVADLDAGGEKRAMEKELEALMERLERVRMEADEAYALELAVRDGQEVRVTVSSG
ncbi:Uncharacterized protein TCAP_04114 [Tolypocladium capitatum]|uniref:Uncharacterized protein n=1 Tax=Tolypocladium capitatum TaxID=45235 RepID=A0A2K3QEJ5_9HYPO|nr:Uncharacterized protein TCAP_04114 [Tolypocladium capitatum]